MNPFDMPLSPFEQFSKQLIGSRVVSCLHDTQGIITIVFENGLEIRVYVKDPNAAVEHWRVADHKRPV